MKHLFLIMMALFLSHPAYAQELSDSQICRAAISTVMGQELKDVEFYKEVKQVKYIAIPQKKDHSTFKFKCTAENGRIQWGSEFGNWQDSDLDSLINYEIKEGFLFIREKYNSGYVLNKRYKLDDLDSK